MSADKRSVFTDALETLGSILDGNQHRDAIHIGVEQVVANHRMLPGSHIGRLKDGTYGVQADKIVGIADPFILGAIEKGDYIWLCVYPRKITSLRHVWTHPDFEEVTDLPEPEVELLIEAQVKQLTAHEESVIEARDWIETYVSRINRDEYRDWMSGDYGTTPLTYEELMEAADDAATDPDGWNYITKGPMLEGLSLDPRFWDHYQVVRGVTLGKVPTLHFSCSC